MNIRKKFPGFTLIELLVVVAIVASLLGAITISLATSSDNTSLSTTVDTIISEIKQQQLKAMVGDTDGTGSNGTYGIHFETTGYTVFKGASYDVSNATNVFFEYGSNVELVSSTFPSATIIFSRLSGEINGFVVGSDSVTLESAGSLEQKTILFNQYGVVTSIN